MAAPPTAYPVQQDAIAFWNNAVSAWQVVADTQPLPVTSAGGTANGSPASGNPVLIAGSDGTNVRTLLTAVSQDTGLASGVLATEMVLADNNGGTFASLSAQALYRNRTVSAANASQQIVVDLRNLHDTLAIVSVCSAGTATLLVEVSADNTNWLTIDSVAAAASTAKQYTATTVGATTAVSPLSFRWVRITAGAAGLGNTTTLTIAAK